MNHPSPAPAADPAERLLRLVRELARAGSPTVRLDSRLDRDLGLDSLGRSELFARAEREFGVRLPEGALLSETPGELLGALLAASGGRAETVWPAPAAERAGPVQGEPATAGTLIQVLEWHVQMHPERVHIRLYGEGDEPTPIRYATLWQEAARVAGGLVRRGVRSGDRVALMLPTGEDYFFAFFGTLLAGAVPLPIYPPVRPSQMEEHLLRHAGILHNAACSLLITVPRARRVARLLQMQVPELRHLVTRQELAQEAAGGSPVARAPHDLAFLQYTSGSTGSPKGVMLTHAHLLANIRAMGQAVQVRPDDLFVSWLPLYHDMGLIGAWLGSLYYGLPLVAMSPLRFLARPSQWLWALHRHRGTLSAAPNFAYELCLSKVTREQVEGLDLSAWRWAFNGAEPVNPGTMRRFAERFARHGLRPQALAPVYGLAEATVGLAFPPPGRGLRVDAIRRDTLLRTGRAERVPESHGDAQLLVACGRPLAGYRVRIVDASGTPLPERCEGRLQFQGPSATSGYFRNEQATATLFQGDWLETGDRAYLADGELFITGRSKEMIIRGGRNLFPYEVEQAVGNLEGVRKGCVALFAAPDPDSGTERVVLLAETREQGGEARERLGAALREKATELLGEPPDDILLAPPHAVLKTSSGKIRRAALAQMYLGGHLGEEPQPVWRQLLRVALKGARIRLRNACWSAGEWLFAARAWSAFWLLVPPVWLAVLLLPRMSWRWAVIRSAIRLLRRLTGLTLEVEGRERVPPPGRPWVLVANHASYLDALFLIDAIPRDLVYVAKRELQSAFFSRVFLRRLGTLFVERFDPIRSAADAERLQPPLEQGQDLAFFPEGTFRAAPGLLPFRMGAFVAAAGAAVPVLPVALKGTRELLRAGTWRPRPSRIQVMIGDLLIPGGKDWNAAARLRDAAREIILAASGEPDIEPSEA
jgi:1-acyl-sn-glycerol-3-phosphate acyltransferase